MKYGRKVAIVGGSRIPFARSNTAYTNNLRGLWAFQQAVAKEDANEGSH